MDSGSIGEHISLHEGDITLLEVECIVNAANSLGSGSIGEHICLHEGDITLLEVECIVNAANNTLSGGGGVDGAIHKAAGALMAFDLAEIGYCHTGQALITLGRSLPAAWAIHTVGPTYSVDKLEEVDALECQSLLQSCYYPTLELAKQNGLTQIAFCCISTDAYQYPMDEAADIAISTVQYWMEHQDPERQIQRAVFVTKRPVETLIYHQLLESYYPEPGDEMDWESVYRWWISFLQIRMKSRMLE